jgi:hypothetical protein
MHIFRMMLNGLVRLRRTYRRLKSISSVCVQCETILLEEKGKCASGL